MKIVYFSKFLRKTPRLAKPIPTAGENPLLMTLNKKLSTWFLRGSNSSQMVQLPFEIFLVPAWLGVLT